MPLRTSLFFFLFAIVSHSIYLFSSIQFWDGSIYQGLIEAGQYDDFMLPWIQNGRPLLAETYWFLGRVFGFGLGLRAFVVLCVVISGLLTSLLLFRVRMFSHVGALAAGLLLVALPPHHVYASFTTIVFIVFLPFFLVAVWAGLRADETKGVARCAFLVLSILTLLISFISEAYTVPAVLIPALRLVLQNRNWLDKTELIQAYRRDFLYVLIPVFYVVLMPILQPVSGEYSASRDLNLSPVGLLKVSVQYMSMFMKMPIFGFIGLGWFLAAIGGLSLYLRKKNGLGWKWLSRDKGALFVFSLFMFAAFAFPFVAASRTPLYAGWNARHYVAILFPMAWIVVLWIEILVPSDRLKRIFLSLVVLGCAVTLGKFNLIWEARQAFELGAASKLAEINIREATTVYAFPRGAPAHGEDFRIYEWNALLRYATGDLNRLIKISPPPPDELPADDLQVETSVQYVHKLIGDLGESKCWIHVQMAPTTELSWKVGARYLWHRYLNPKQTDGYQRSLSEVKTRSGPDCQFLAISG